MPGKEPQERDHPFRQKVRGFTYVLEDRGRRYRFRAGDGGRYDVGEESVLVTGLVLLADGTVIDAIVELGQRDGGEHLSTFFMTPEGLVRHEEGEFWRALGKGREEVFPYRYRYDAVVPHDCHIGPDGWSL